MEPIQEAHHYDASGWHLRLWTDHSGFNRVHLDPPPKWTLSGLKRLYHLADELKAKYKGRFFIVVMPETAVRGYSYLATDMAGMRAFMQKYAKGVLNTWYRT